MPSQQEIELIEKLMSFLQGVLAFWDDRRMRQYTREGIKSALDIAAQLTLLKYERKIKKCKHKQKALRPKSK